MTATVRRVPVPTDTLAPDGTTNAHVVGETDAVLIDPASRTDDLDGAVDAVDVNHVLVTHAHPDHVGGVAHYADARDATVWARQGREDRFERATGVDPDRTFREGTEVGDLRVMETPGHAPDHVALVARDERDGRDDGGRDGQDFALTGDLVVSSGSVLVGADEGDLRAYLASLRRLYARTPATLYPGHGPVIDDPRATVERLLRHRLDRERKVLSAVRNGARTLDDVLDAAYEKDLTGVRDLARRTVAAHLEKLTVERKVTWDGERATPR